MNRSLSLFVLFAVLSLLLSACGGTLEVAFDTTATPNTGQAATVAALETRVATLGPAFRPLDLNASEAEIRQWMLNSHESWGTIWVDGVATYRSADGVRSERLQLWVDRRSAWFRSLMGPAEGSPTAMQVSDGTSQERIDLTSGQVQTYPLMDASRDPNWQVPPPSPDTVTPHPLDLEIDSPLSDMVFSTNFAQRDGTYSPVGMEKVAGRPAILLEWSINGQPPADRIWVDTRTGVILRWQSFGKDPGAGPHMEFLVYSIEYDVLLPAGLFSLRVSEPPMFAVDPSGVTMATPVPPQTGFTPGAGELYFVINRAPEPLQLVRLPGNCVTGSDPCPQPQVIAGFPNEGSTIEPLIWSPDGSQALLVHEGVLYRFDPQGEAWTALAQFPILFAPAWSNDGQWIAFVVQMDDNHQDIYAVRADGTDLQNLTNGQFTGGQTYLWVYGWLSDGRVLVNVMERLASELWTAQPGQQSAERFSDLALNQVLFALAPDGQTLAYSDVNGSALTLYLSSALSGGAEIGENARRLATFQQAGMQQILWSPDGNWLAFLLSSGSGDDSHVSTLYVVTRYGSDLRQLYQARDIRRMVFTGDSQALIIEGTENGRLYVIPLDGAARLVDAPGLRLDQAQMGISWR